MIQVNKIEPPKWEAFDPDGNSLGWLNMFEFYDLKIQIKEHGVEGYYMIFNDEVFKNRKIRIDKDGHCDGWPNGFYDLAESQLRKLLGF
jgi:predicted ATPase